MPDVDDPRLLRIECSRPAPSRSWLAASRRDTRLRRGRAGDDPVVRVPRELITLASHLPIKRGQENVAQQRRGYPALRRPSFSREEPALCRNYPPVSMASMRRKHSAIGHTSGHEREEFLVVHRPEKVLQVCIHNPFRCPLRSPSRSLRRASFVDRPRRYPKLASSNTGSKIGSRRLSRACWHTRSINRRDAEHAPLTRFARLRDAHRRLTGWGSITVGLEAPHAVESRRSSSPSLEIAAMLCAVNTSSPADWL